MAMLDIIQYTGDMQNEIVHRVPEAGAGQFRLGSQLVVRESQAAVFFRDGKALDTFGPGRHTISTNNVPLLTRLLSLPFGGQSPFTAEVFFVSLREFLDLKWGTPEPLTLRDSDLGMVRLRAFGTYSIQVSDPQMFVNKIVGNQGMYDTNQIQGYLRGIIISRLTDTLGSLRRSLLDLPALFDEIAAAVRAKTADDFAALGITMKALYIGSISPTEETAKAIDERASMGAIGDMQKYMQFKAARAVGDAATSGSGGAAGTGVGFGAGIGLGGVLAQQMGQAFASGQQAPPQTSSPAPATSAASANPQTSAEVQALLDNLDLRLANGQINEDTYNRLYARWEAKLKEMSGK